MNCSQSRLPLSRPSSDSMTAIRCPFTVRHAVAALPDAGRPGDLLGIERKIPFQQVQPFDAARSEQSFQGLGTIRHDLFDRIRVSEEIVGQMSCKPVAGFRGGECACRLQVAAGRPDFVERDVGAGIRKEGRIRRPAFRLAAAPGERSGCPGRLPWLAIDRVLPAGPCRADRSAAPCTRRATTRPRPTPRLRTGRKPRPYRIAEMP